MDRWSSLPQDLRSKVLTYIPNRDLENASLAGRSMREDVESTKHFRMRDTVRHEGDAKEVYTRRLRLENGKIICFTLGTNESGIETLSWYLIYDMNEDDIKRALDQFIVKIREEGWPLIPTQSPTWGGMAGWERFMEGLRRNGSGVYYLSQDITPGQITDHIQAIVSPSIRDVETISRRR